jgi:hypothetical protein
MKTAHRVHRNGGKKPASIQSETLPNNPPGKTPHQLLTIVAGLSETEGGRKGEIIISEFADREIIRVSERDGIKNYEKTFDFIFRSGLSRVQGQYDVLKAFGNLENITAELDTLLELVTRVPLSWNRDGCPSKEYFEAFENGLFHLSARLLNVLRQNIAAARLPSVDFPTNEN